MEMIEMCFLTIREARRKNKIKRLTNSAPDKGSLSSMHVAVFSLFVTKHRERNREARYREMEREKQKQ